jgi:hypothetical protein
VYNSPTGATDPSGLHPGFAPYFLRELWQRVFGGPTVRQINVVRQVNVVLWDCDANEKQTTIFKKVVLAWYQRYKIDIDVPVKQTDTWENDRS